MAKIHLLISLWTLLREVSGFSGGAPESVCDGSMTPRHGFDPQEVSPAAEIVLDQYTMRSDHYLRVTLRGQIPFKGFLLKAEDILDQSKQSLRSFSAFGTWYIPYLNDSDAEMESEYLHCNGGLQNAVTHTGKAGPLYVVSFQWKPPVNYQGMVTFRATVVRDYKTFWTDITSPPVHIVSGNQHILVDTEQILVDQDVVENVHTVGKDGVENYDTFEQDNVHSDDALGDDFVGSVNQYSDKITTFPWSTSSYNPISVVKVKSTRPSKSPRINTEGERDYYNSRNDPPPYNYKDKDKAKVSSQSTKTPKPSYQSIKSIISSQSTIKSIISSQTTIKSTKNKPSDSAARQSSKVDGVPVRNPPLQNNSELNRRPRTNEGVTQIPYERLQADFGGFDEYSDSKNGANYVSAHFSLQLIVMIVVFKTSRIVIQTLNLN